jgi:hypothetical protein
MSTRRVLAFTAIGLSAAALAFGIVEHISWQGKVDDFKSMEPCGSDLTDRGGPGCRSLYDDGQQAKWLAFVGYGAAAAFAAGAAVLYFTDPARTTGSRQLACAPAMSWSSSSITCGLRF